MRGLLRRGIERFFFLRSTHRTVWFLACVPAAWQTVTYPAPQGPPEFVATNINQTSTGCSNRNEPENGYGGSYKDRPTRSNWCWRCCLRFLLGRTLADLLGVASEVRCLTYYPATGSEVGCWSRNSSNVSDGIDSSSPFLAAERAVPPGRSSECADPGAFSSAGDAPDERPEASAANHLFRGLRAFSLPAHLVGTAEEWIRRSPEMDGNTRYSFHCNCLILGE